MRAAPLAFALTLAGCGRLDFGDQPARDSGGGSNHADGGGDSADSSPDAPASGFITVITYGDFPATLAGVTAWTNRADGTLDDTQTSDANGSATLHIDRGGSVAVGYGSDVPDSLGPRVAAVLDIAPGDAFAFGDNLPACDNFPMTGTMTIAWSDFTGSGSADDYRTGVPCSSAIRVTGQEPFTYDMDFVPSLANPYDIAITARDSSFTVVGFATMAQVPLVNGTTVTVPANAWTPPELHTYGVGGLPVYITGGLTQTFIAPNSILAGTSTSTAPSAGTQTGGIALPSTLPADVILWGVFSGGGHDLEIEQRFDHPLPSQFVAVPPSVPDPQTVAYDTSTREVRFTDSGSGSVDGVYATVRTGTGGTAPTWTVWAPPTARVFLPQPPAGLVVPDPGEAAVAGIAEVRFGMSASWSVLRQREEWRVPYGDPRMSPFEDVTLFALGEPPLSQVAKSARARSAMRGLRLSLRTPSSGGSKP